jgi:hypothetical protein
MHHFERLALHFLCPLSLSLSSQQPVVWLIHHGLTQARRLVIFDWHPEEDYQEHVVKNQCVVEREGHRPCFGNIWPLF